MSQRLLHAGCGVVILGVIGIIGLLLVSTRAGLHSDAPRASERAALDTAVPLVAPSGGDPFATMAVSPDYPPEKRELAAQIATEQAAPSIGGLDPIPTHDPAAPTMELRRTFGINNNSPYSPFWARATLKNKWFGRLGETFAGVYAGWVTLAPEVGFLGVARGDNGEEQSAFVIAEGPVQIMAVDNDVFTLQTDSGLTFTFDLRTETFAGLPTPRRLMRQADGSNDWPTAVPATPLAYLAPDTSLVYPAPDTPLAYPAPDA